MRLYFLRHGIAEGPEAVDGDDRRRALTPKGVERMRLATRALPLLKVRPTRLYSSPLVRALQTAEIVSPALNLPVEVRAEVAPGFSLDAVEQLIADLTGEDDVMFVGHEPDFSTTISALIGGGAVVMKKGGLARVDVTSLTPLRGALVWLLAPRALRTLGVDS